MRISAGLPLAFLTLAAIVTAVAGCSGSGLSSVTSSATATPLPAPTAVCTAPAGYTIQMVFPQQNAAAAANLQGVVFAISPSPLPTNWYFYVTHVVSGATLSTYGTAQIGFLGTPAPGPSPTVSSSATASPTPLPTPSDTPSGEPSPTYETASIGTFATSTKFDVFLANSNCTPASPSALPSSQQTLWQGEFTTATIDTPTATPSPTST